MTTFKIELVQVNKQGEKTFEATAKGLKVNDEANLAVEIADFCCDAFDTSNNLQKLGVKGMSKTRVKISQPLTCKLTCIDDDTEVSFELGNFGALVRDLTKKKLEKVFDIQIGFTQKFAHIWA